MLDFLVVAFVVAFLVVDLIVFVVFVAFAAAFLRVLAVLVAGVALLWSSSVACSKVIVFGSRSAGILRLLGRGRPLPEAGLMAGPLMYGPKGP